MREYFLHTDRISFSVWTKDDISLARELWSDGDVTKYISASGKFTDEEISARLDTEIRNYEMCGMQYFPIFTKDTAEFIGCCGLRPYKEDGIQEAGFHLKKKFWGKGYAYEAAEAIINYAFENLGSEKIFAGHNPKNENSRKVLLKLGFSYTHDEFYPPTGLMHPSYIKNKL